MGETCRNQPLNPNPRVKPREGQVRGGVRDLKLSALVGGTIVEVGEGVGAQPVLVVRVARRG